MSRVGALREKNVIVKLVKDLNKKMGDFEASVEELKILKESITEMYDDIKSQEDENNRSLERLKADLKDNKTKILNDAAESVGKVIISKDYLEELRREVEKLSTDHKKHKASLEEVVNEKVEDLIQHRLKLQELEHKTEITSLEAAVENYKKEIENLNKSFERMTKELESQKKLSANLALANRPSQTTGTSHTN